MIASFYRKKPTSEGASGKMESYSMGVKAGGKQGSGWARSQRENSSFTANYPPTKLRSWKKRKG